MRLAQVARPAPLEAGAALLAVASPRRGPAAERMVELARRELSADPLRLAAALGSNIPAPMPRTKAAKRAKRKAETDRGQTVSFNGAVVGSTPPAVPLERESRGPEVEVAPEVAVRLRDDADAVITERVGGEQPLHWRLPATSSAFESGVEVRAAAAERGAAAGLGHQASERARPSDRVASDRCRRGRARRARWSRPRPRCWPTTPPAACWPSSRQRACAAGSGWSSR